MPKYIIQSINRNLTHMLALINLTYKMAASKAQHAPEVVIFVDPSSKTQRQMGGYMRESATKRRKIAVCSLPVDCSLVIVAINMHSILSCWRICGLFEHR